MNLLKGQLRHTHLQRQRLHVHVWPHGAMLVSPRRWHLLAVCPAALPGALWGQGGPLGPTPPPSIHLSTQPPSCSCSQPPIHPPVSHSFHLSVPLFLYRPVHPPTHLSIIHPPSGLSIHPPICPSSVHPFTHTAVVITPHSPTSCKYTVVLAGLALFFIGQSFSCLGSTRRVWGSAGGPRGQ